MLAVSALLATAFAANATCKCGIFTYPQPSQKTIGCPLVTAAGMKQDPNKEIPLPEYPRPQMTRSGRWEVLNGWWEFEPAGSGNETHPPPLPPTDSPLKDKIVVPYPPEACLSGIWINHYGDEKIPNDNTSWAIRLWYRRKVVLNANVKTVIHFDAVDWVGFVYLDGKLLGSHVGGFSRFSFEVTATTTGNHTLTVYTYDPTDFGGQVRGKQRINAILHPSGDTYSPTSGIWGTVWLEEVQNTYIEDVRIDQEMSAVVVNVSTTVFESNIEITATDPTGAVVATGRTSTNVALRVIIPDADNYLWTPDTPHLYNLTITVGADTVVMYFALRTFTTGIDAHGIVRPFLNGKPFYASGVLDQSWWPDGMYTPPDLASAQEDISYVKELGFNMIRLHQKVNPPTWYHQADKIGMIIFQDMPQHYGDWHQPPIGPSVQLYKDDLKLMIKDLWNVPSIVQWTLFNEQDMVSHFNVPEIVTYAEGMVGDSRLIDTNSGGPANGLYLADVDDIHHYPWPLPNKAKKNQYCMAGEWGGVGYFIPGHEWVEGQCGGYAPAANSSGMLDMYLSALDKFIPYSVNISASVITQTTDIERECDGFFTYDRVKKFSDAEGQQFAAKMAILKKSMPN
eukprot:TRINITY_DN2435_c0_g1_i1.p1 TRINITY_DN2435_c0_g1~~TRINITY_DN2435_c0_g1_i1.p1  ORF type:complete len:639 (+),score=133.74 TRINITY_DN2435_c0_g1_i1:49-1917(+)